MCFNSTVQHSRATGALVGLGGFNANWALAGSFRSTTRREEEKRTGGYKLNELQGVLLTP